MAGIVAVGAGMGLAVDAEGVTGLRPVHHHVSDQDEGYGILAERKVLEGNPGTFDLRMQGRRKDKQQDGQEGFPIHVHKYMKYFE